jgi:hypothetical protein
VIDNRFFQQKKGHENPVLNIRTKGLHGLFKAMAFVVLLLQDGSGHPVFSQYITGNRQSQPISRQGMHPVPVFVCDVKYGPGFGGMRVTIRGNR